MQELDSALPAAFLDSLILSEEENVVVKSARKVQQIDDGIKAQEQVFSLSSGEWSKILVAGSSKNLFSPKEIGILEVAAQIPARLPSEKQCLILLGLLERCRNEGIISGNRSE